MPRQFKTSDEGKTVVTADGDEVGTIEKIEGDMAHVRPKGSLSRSIRRRLGWAEDEDAYEIEHSRVQQISGDEVHLKD
jgi:sporulation protein YlmC with PRC-barrel domain